MRPATYLVEKKMDRNRHTNDLSFMLISKPFLKRKILSIALLITREFVESSYICMHAHYLELLSKGVGLKKFCGDHHHPKLHFIAPVFNNIYNPPPLI